MVLLADFVPRQELARFRRVGGTGSLWHCRLAVQRQRFGTGIGQGRAAGAGRRGLLRSNAPQRSTAGWNGDNAVLKPSGSGTGTAAQESECGIAVSGNLQVTQYGKRKITVIFPNRFRRVGKEKKRNLLTQHLLRLRSAGSCAPGCCCTWCRCSEGCSLVRPSVTPRALPTPRRPSSGTAAVTLSLSQTRTCTNRPAGSLRAPRAGGQPRGWSGEPFALSPMALPTVTYAQWKTQSLPRAAPGQSGHLLPRRQQR